MPGRLFCGLRGPPTRGGGPQSVLQERDGVIITCCPRYCWTNARKAEKPKTTYTQLNDICSLGDSTHPAFPSGKDSMTPRTYPTRTDNVHTVHAHGLQHRTYVSFWYVKGQHGVPISLSSSLEFRRRRSIEMFDALVCVFFWSL
jgi:hypothetical protein